MGVEHLCWLVVSFISSEQGKAKEFVIEDDLGEVFETVEASFSFFTGSMSN